MINDQWIKENGNKNVSVLFKELTVNEFLSLIIKFSQEVHKKESSNSKLFLG